MLYLTVPSMYKVCVASALDEGNIKASVVGMVPTGER